MRYAWFVLLAVGCYTAPDYGDTHFKCDATHACPDGQQCVSGVCGGSGSGSNQVDAAISANGVKCGTLTCSASQKCCADFVSGLSCVALSATCNGFAASCDGIEDCGANKCCETTGGTIGCAPTCSGQTICLDNTDCVGASAPTCCTILGTMEPWGRCLNVCP